MAQAPVTESNIIDQYRQKCDFKISKFKTKIQPNTKFKLPDDPNSTGVCETVMENRGAHISVKFDDNSLYENEMKVSFQGPSLRSTCTISVIKRTVYHREFGYIQTSKRFYENEFKNAIAYSDFHANLFHDQDEVLDSDSESSPFYSSDSCTKVPASQIPPNTIQLHFSDCPTSDISKYSHCPHSEASPEHNYGCLQKHERYQQFFVYLVMRSKMDNGEWKYDVIFTFDWFIYLKWTKVSGKNNNSFEYNCGLKKHEPTRDLPDWIISNEFYACNDDEIEYSIDKSNCNFNIDYYPKSISKNDLERIYDKMEFMVSKQKTGFENLKIRISNANKWSGNNEIRDSWRIALQLNESGEDIEKMFSIEKSVYKDIDNLLLDVKKLCEDLKEMDLEKIKFLDKKGWKLNVCKEIMNSIEKVITSLRPKVITLKDSLKSQIVEVEKLSKNIEIVDSENKEFRENIRNIELEVNKLYNCIEQMDSRERDVYNYFESLIPKIDNLATDVGKMNLEKNESRGDFPSSDEKMRESLLITETVDWKELKIIESIDFGRYKFCK